MKIKKTFVVIITPLLLTACGSSVNLSKDVSYATSPNGKMFTGAISLAGDKAPSIRLDDNGILTINNTQINIYKGEDLIENDAELLLDEKELKFGIHNKLIERNIFFAGRKTEDLPQEGYGYYDITGLGYQRITAKRNNQVMENTKKDINHSMIETFDVSFTNKTIDITARVGDKLSKLQADIKGNSFSGQKEETSKAIDSQFAQDQFELTDPNSSRKLSIAGNFFGEQAKFVGGNITYTETLKGKTKYNDNVINIEKRNHIVEGFYGEKK